MTGRFNLQMKLEGECLEKPLISCCCFGVLSLNTTAFRLCLLEPIFILIVPRFSHVHMAIQVVPGPAVSATVLKSNPKFVLLIRFVTLDEFMTRN